MKETLKKPLVIILYSSILAFLNAGPAYFFVNMGFFTTDSLWFSVTVTIGAFFIMFVIPGLVIKFSFSKTLADFGFRRPESWSQAIKLTLITLLIFLPILFIFAKQPNFRSYYSINGDVGVFFILVSIITSSIYYFSEEFLFRGFLFFGLWDKLKMHTFWITNLIFAILHFSKPSGEAFFAFSAGLALSYLSYKTKSFLPAVVVHLILALILNSLVLFT